MEGLEPVLLNILETGKTHSSNLSEIKEHIKSLQNKGDNTQLVEELKQLIIRQTSEIENLKNKKIDIEFPKVKTQDSANNITIFGGNNAQINYQWALIFIGVILVSYFGFKHIPSYLNNSRALETETIRNKQYIKLLRLKEFKEKGDTEEIDTFLDEVENLDSTFVSQYNSLIAYYNEEIERIRTEREIEELQDKLNKSK